ncbi:MAG: hypothetical protein ACR2H6_02270 [Pyrinomonadaceae bacterium]
MPASKSPKSKSVPEDRNTSVASKTPHVIVDFVFERGVFFITVRNISEQPAYKVSVKFDQKLFGLGGAREVSALPLFRNIEFLAPQKEIATLLDSSDSYFARKQPTKIKVQISYRDAEGDKHDVSISHDLDIYRTIAFIEGPASLVLPDADQEGE